MGIDCHLRGLRSPPVCAFAGTLLLLLFVKAELERMDLVYGRIVL